MLAVKKNIWDYNTMFLTDVEKNLLR